LNEFVAAFFQHLTTILDDPYMHRAGMNSHSALHTQKAVLDVKNERASGWLVMAGSYTESLLTSSLPPTWSYLYLPGPILGVSLKPKTNVGITAIPVFAESNESLLNTFVETAIILKSFVHLLSEHGSKLIPRIVATFKLKLREHIPPSSWLTGSASFSSSTRSFRCPQPMRPTPTSPL
jgi:hypothetical protein